MDRMQSTSPTAIKALISYSLLYANAPQEARTRAAQNSFNSLSWFKSALTAYMHDTALKLQCSVQDIHWMFQAPHEVSPGEYASSGCDSFSGWLSLVTSHSACVIESLILEAEHEFLEVSTGAASTGGSPSLLQQLQKEARTSIGPVDTGTPLEPELLQCLHLSTGINGTCPMAVAIKSIVYVMLHQNTSVLPFGVWRAACMHIVRWLQESIKGMQKRTPDVQVANVAKLLAQQQQVTGSGGVLNLPHAAMPAAHLIMMRAMLGEVIAAVNEAPVQVLLSFHCMYTSSSFNSSFHPSCACTLRAASDLFEPSLP